MTEPKFFVVRKFHDHEHFSFENGDLSARYPKEERDRIVYRAQMPEGDATTLSDAIGAYRRGVRLKPPPAPPPVEKPKDKNSVKERYLAKLRATAVDKC